ncbi:hypothetical protein SOPP22_00285 [Shewanella sp. OPT22]|nr:hypothetical protein SOPP22_00285 [Shewanella sp. OPT22]
MLLWIGLFGSNVSVLMAALIGAPILFLTSQRRCRDANKPQWMGLLTQVPWWLTALLTSFSGSVSWWLATMLLGVIGSMLLAVFPSRSVGRFELGYQGPAIQHLPKASATRRVEPSLNSEAEHVEAESFSAIEDHSSISSQIQEVIEEAPLNQKQWLMAGVGVLGLAVIGILMSSLVSTDGNADEEQTAMQPEITEHTQPRETVSLRDGFELSLQGDKLFMSWLGSDGGVETLWQLDNAQGDRSCRHLRFNNGTTYRPMTVERLADRNNSSQADFSPLDTKAIIKDVARRGKVSLCGYTFSLKGSQSDLSKNAIFRAYIE